MSKSISEYMSEVNINATPDEQRAVFLNPNNTGIHNLPRSGDQSAIGNQNYIFDPTYQNKNLLDQNIPQGQRLLLSGGRKVIAIGDEAEITSVSELITNGIGSNTNILKNMPDADLINGRPCWDYAPMERLDSLPAYQSSRARLLDNIAYAVDSDNYSYFIVGIPSSESEATIQWKDTFRCQVKVPPGSYLTQILAAKTPASITSPNQPMRFSIYDDGAGEYLYNYVGSQRLCAGSMVDHTLIPGGGPRGAFFLPSPFAISAPGIITVAITNDNDSLNDGTPYDTNSIVAHMALVFAVSKSDRAKYNRDLGLY